jgi:hypothetical protein
MRASEAFDYVCTIIYEKYKDNGWKYSKSSHCMSKKDKKFMYKVFFYTSGNNITDKDVTFHGECAIVPLKSKNKIFSANIRQYKISNGKLYWNITKERDWEQAVNEFSNWLDNEFMPIVDSCTNDLDNFVKQVVLRGFYPQNGYIIDIAFVLANGSRELAEEATKRYYDSLGDSEKSKFKENYESMINGNEAISAYGKNMMRNYSNFKTIVENKIIVKL